MVTQVEPLPISPGAGGRQALAQLQEALERGQSVLLYVDGPAGPAAKVTWEK